MAQDKRPVSIITEAGHELATLEAYAAPASITVRRLGWKRLAEAEKAGAIAAFSTVRDMGGPRVMRELQDAVKAALETQPDAGDAKAALKAEAAKNPLAAYDLGALLFAGIVSMDGLPAGRDIGPEIESLEPEVAEAAATQILRLSRPSLFETEEARKND